MKQHLYNCDEIAQIALYIGSTLEDNSIFSDKYKNRPCRPEDNDANDSYYVSLQKVREDLSEKLKGLNGSIEMDFIYGKSKNSYRLTWFEAHALIFLLLYPSHKGTLISKIKNDKMITYQELDSLFDNLNDFLNDERFYKGGIWFQEECRIINEEPIAILIEPLRALVRSEINLKIRKMQTRVLLGVMKNIIAHTAINAICEGLDRLIPNDEMRIPLLSPLEFFKDDGSEEIYKEGNLPNEDDEDDYELDDFIHSGTLKDEDCFSALKWLIKFNNEIENKIISLFEHMAVEIVPKPAELVTSIFTLDQMKSIILDEDEDEAE